jgi:hypothetical protein
MLKKVVLNYDDVTSNITDKNGTHILTWVGLVYEEPSKVISAPLKSEDVCDLKRAGFTIDEIERIHKKGIL